MSICSSFATGRSTTRIFRTYSSSLGDARELFLRKKEYVLGRPPFWPEQRFGDFCTAVTLFSNTSLDGKVFGNTAWFGAGGMEYVTFIGLRSDEQRRLARVGASVHAKSPSEGEGNTARTTC